MRDPDPLARIRRRLDQLAEELALDRERIRGWAVVHAVAWGGETGPGWDPAMVACANWLAEAYAGLAGLPPTYGGGAPCIAMNASLAMPRPGSPACASRRPRSGDEPVHATFPSRTRCTQSMRESSIAPPWRTRSRPRTATTSPCDQIPSRIESTCTPRAAACSI